MELLSTRSFAGIKHRVELLSPANGGGGRGEESGHCRGNHGWDGTAGDLQGEAEPGSVGGGAKAGEEEGCRPWSDEYPNTCSVM